MKVQNTPKLQLNSKSQNPTTGNETKVAFKGLEFIPQALNFLQTNQGLGATFVDAGFMCTPRTVVDFTRGPQAGTETAIREFTSCINDAALGVYGIGVAALVFNQFNKKYNVKADKMFVDNDTLDILADTCKTAGKSDLTKTNNLRSYLNEVVEQTTAFNPHAQDKTISKGWVSIASGTKKDMVDKLVLELVDGKEKTKEEIEEIKSHIKTLFVRDTGAETEVKLARKLLNPKTQNRELVESTVALNDYIDNLYKVSKAFMSKQVKETFADGTFVNTLKKLNITKAFTGIALCSVIGASVQPINMYLTRKRTGTTGFVGGGKEDKSTGFKAKKNIVAALGALAMWATIDTTPSKILSKIQFKGLWPTLNQFKMVYSITIISRLLSSRNDNELREASIKDSLGFANWLILGGFASKLTALGFEKFSKDKNNKFIKYNAEEHGKGWFNWITKSSILTREEVLHDSLKKAGVSVIEKDKALSLKEMLVKATKIDIIKKTKIRAKVRHLGAIQLAGYLWSGLALGVGIPKLNIAITKHFEKKKQAEEADKN